MNGDSMYTKSAITSLSATSFLQANSAYGPHRRPARWELNPNKHIGAMKDAVKWGKRLHKMLAKKYTIFFGFHCVRSSSTMHTILRFRSCYYHVRNGTEPFWEQTHRVLLPIVEFLYIVYMRWRMRPHIPGKCFSRAAKESCMFTFTPTNLNRLNFFIHKFFVGVISVLCSIKDAMEFYETQLSNFECS